MMKYFDANKINRNVIVFLEALFRVMHFLLAKIKMTLFKNTKPCVVLVDGFLIGDAVLLRPLVKGLIDKFSVTHRIVVISGRHALYIYADYKDKIEIITYQFPWASHDYSINNLLRLFALWLNLYGKSVDMAIESRGDFRSISWTYLFCPRQLIGFDFTGGGTLLSHTVPDDGNIVHLFEHVKRIAVVVGCNIEISDIQYPKPHTPSNTKKIGLSFSGSQQLRNLPITIGLDIIERVIDETDYEVWYMRSPHKECFSADLLANRFGDKVKIFYGNFGDYFIFIKTLDMYLGMDSGGGHLCSLWGIPSVIMFGTQMPSYTKPVGNYPLYCAETKNKLECRPCNGVQCINEQFQKCLYDIDIGNIIEYCKKIAPTS